MANPQQPELARSRRSAATPQDPVGGPPPTDDRLPDQTPPGNRPGRRPKVDQDKPRRPPPRPVAARSGRFDFASEPPLRAASLLAGVLPGKAYVDVEPDTVDIRFGPWHMRLDRQDIEGAEVSDSPFNPLKVAGPPHLSLADRGITFATSRYGGVCIRLRTPQPGIEPLGLIRHPAVTVTVDDPHGLAQLLDA